MVRVNINNEIAQWAIHRAGFSLAEFERSYPKHKSWLEGKREATFNQAKDFSKKVHLPFGYLLLEKIPDLKLPIPYYRTIENTQQPPSTNLYDLVQEVQSRQDWLVDYLEENGEEDFPFVGKFDVEDDDHEIIQDIRRVLSIPEDWAQNYEAKKNPRKYLIHKIEQGGIYTTFSSSAGRGNARPIKVNEDCRGFVLVHPKAPFVWVNSKDAKGAQHFTLIHELVHIWLGESAAFQYFDGRPANDPIDKKCDNIAAKFLVPAQLLGENWKGLDQIKKLAQQFAVSPIVIARRAMDLQMIARSDFFDWYERYQIELEGPNSGIQKREGNYYNNLPFKIGHAFGKKVYQATQEGRLLYRDAFRLTGLKGKTFEKHFNPEN